MQNEREDHPHEGERAYNDERTRNPEAILSRVMRTRDEKPEPKVRFEDTPDGEGCVTTGPNFVGGIDAEPITDEPQG